MHRLGQQQSFHIKRQHGGNLLLFTLAIVVVIHHQRLVTMPGGDRFDAGQQIGKNLIMKGGNEYANPRHGDAGHRRIIRVGLIADLRYHASNTLRRLRFHLFRGAQIAANGHLGYASQLGNIMESNALCFHLCVRQIPDCFRPLCLSGGQKRMPVRSR